MARTGVLLGEVFDRAMLTPGQTASAPAVESFKTVLRGLDSESRLVRLTVDQDRFQDPGVQQQAPV